MQALILAAGMGNRLGKYTKNNTKCMLRIHEKTLIERALSALAGAGIKKCVIVAGYQKENLMNFVGARHGDMDIDYIINPVYHKTNNIYSLYLAKEYLARDDTILLESDLIFEDRLIAGIVSCPESTVAAVAKWEAWMDGTVVELVDDNKIATFVPKKLFNFDRKDRYYKTVNIYKFAKEFSTRTYIPFLEAYIKSLGNNEYYEQVLRVITMLDHCDLRAFRVTNQKWYEIDDIQDKDIAETLFAPEEKTRLKLISRRYGGYWRFPQLLDFCYLVNPYFPPPQMMTEIKSYFSELITGYPSGLNVENLLAAKLFNLDESTVLTGNGAAELIKALAGTLNGTTGIIEPGFNEYAECFALAGIKTAVWRPGGFTYDKNGIEAFSAKCDTVVLINPDNPSGNYIPREDLLYLARFLKDHNKGFVVDESFVDFADEQDGTLLHADILSSYPNMTVIKSLSKSYGIPGIRLGVLACADTDLIVKIRKNIPIWNINSFAEYFLQIAGKYRQDYIRACTQIAAERRRFKALLEETGLLSVYPSQANYFLCEVKSGDAFTLASYLLGKHDIFIKDLSGKAGMPQEPAYIRLAVRCAQDNDRLIAALAEFRGAGRK